MGQELPAKAATAVHCKPIGKGKSIAAAIVAQALKFRSALAFIA
jgi:hypothetical protein